MVISNSPKKNYYQALTIIALKKVQFFRTNSALIALCVVLCPITAFTQDQFDFELSKNVISPSYGPKLYGYMGTVHYSYTEKVGISVATGYMKIEESSTYLRDRENSLIDYDKVTDLKIIPLIFGGRYNLFSMGRFETFFETESGLNFLLFEELREGDISKNYEVHLGIGLGGGANLLITDYLRFVIKCKLNVATKIGDDALFHRSSRYVTLSTGLQIGL